MGRFVGIWVCFGLWALGFGIWDLNKRLRMRRLSVASTLIASATMVYAQAPTDWTQWRGPSRDGTLPAFTAPAAWPDTLTQRWKIDVGTGYATPIVVGNRVYMFSRQGENETMSAIDAASGKVLWTNSYPAPFTMMSATVQHGPGPKSTPVFFNNRLYSIGMIGTVTAWDAASGKPVWQKPGDAKNVPTFTTHAFSPIVEGNTVIFHLGGDSGGAITAFDAATG